MDRGGSADQHRNGQYLSNAPVNAPVEVEIGRENRRDCMNQPLDMVGNLNLIIFGAVTTGSRIATIAHSITRGWIAAN